MRTALALALALIAMSTLPDEAAAQRDVRLRVQLPPAAQRGTAPPSVRAEYVFTDPRVADLLRNGFPARLHYRVDVRLGFWNRGDLREFGFHRSPAWVVFVDAGRGWLVGPDRVGDLQFTTGSLPPFSTYKADAGTGFDLGLIGVFVAKALTDSDSPNFFVRLRHRF